VIDWLQPIKDVLENAKKPVRLFFRDDDAGWSTDRLLALLDMFAKAEIPIDLAVIPEALDAKLTDELLLRNQQSTNMLGLHQHGYTHSNNEQEGRKCEFGGSRTKAQQLDDIGRGQKILQAQLGKTLDPFFTPPWNRCTQETVECLEELDFKLLSRDITAKQFTSTKVKQIPVHVDWSKFIKTSSLLPELGWAIASHLESSNPTGIMLHHADMDEEQLIPLAELLSVFKNYNVQGILLRDTIS
jgi:hypothetical protein